MWDLDQEFSGYKSLIGGLILLPVERLAMIIWAFFLTSLSLSAGIVTALHPQVANDYNHQQV